MLVGEGAAEAAAGLAGIATEVRAWETPGFAPGAWATALAPLLADEQVVILPASPDGRDLAPRLAAVLGHALSPGRWRSGRTGSPRLGFGGAVMAEHALREAVVVTLQPGVRGVEPDGLAVAEVQDLDLELPDVPDAEVRRGPPTGRVHHGPVRGAPDPRRRRRARLARTASPARPTSPPALDASMGATRVITDRGWLPHARQIGTTGVVVDPRLYLAFGISGAVQHTAGLGRPDHIISVNTEPHCPMMGLADLAVVADANATLDELACDWLAGDSGRSRTAGDRSSG